ncbi:MAG: hypothetical protein RQ741_13355 [Wenzhouxiangellaceae bacterium]|nr:hypothetical protein [Wenzhouxiangellaceae bacterium]
MARLDPKTNLLSVLLVGAIGLVVVVGLLSFALLGRVDVASIEPAGDGSGLPDTVAAADLDLGELSKFAAITERPVFFESRRLPVVEMDEDGEPDELLAESEPELEIPDLDAKVAGIIITPEVRLAMINDQSSNETLVLREGMAMAGDKSAWKISEIRGRSVRFATDSGEQAELELEVETAALTAGNGGARRRTSPAEQSEPAAQANAANGDDQDAARERAEEIRRRVAERRAQLRAEAERRAQQRDDG